MPYYCTVPRCTSMAGKAKNVSFHQFPRDEELARLWNDILKRGKPYTKYSKVCSLHFKPEDYTITSVGKNKGQWRTLRKDAVPSQNLPSESPAPYSRKQWETWSQNSCTPNVMDPAIHQHMAQAIYMQTMLAMQAAGTTDPTPHQNGPLIPDLPLPHTSTHEEIIKAKEGNTDTSSYKCTECTKCFKDPDVFILHKRSHTKEIKSNGVEKENFNMNLTLRSNPILANLLKTNNEVNIDPNLVTMENLLITALAANMDYLRNFSVVKEERDDSNHARSESHVTGDSNHARSDSYYARSDSHVTSDSNHARSDLYYARSDTHVTGDSNADLNRIRNDLNNVGTELHPNIDPSREMSPDHVKRDFSVNKNSSYTLGVNYYQNHHKVDLNSIEDDLNLIKSDSDHHNHQNHLISELGHSKGDVNDLKSDLNHQKDDLNHLKSDLNHLKSDLNHQKSDLNHQKGDFNQQNSIGISYAMNFSTKVEPNSLKYSGYYKERCFPSEYEKEVDSCDSDSEKNNDFKRDRVSHCDNDLNESLDSNSLVIDESV